MFYLPDVSRSPLPHPRTTAFARARTRAYRHAYTYVRWAHIPGVSRSCLPERRPPPCPVLVSHAARALSLSLSHRRAIRPRLSHRYSRGLLGARGKMRQVVVRSRSPGTREIRLLFSPPFVRPVDPPVRPPARQRPSAIHSCGYINARVCRARVYAYTRV